VARDLKEVSATGNVTTVVPAYLHSVVLTAGSDAASLLVKDGSGGATRLTLKAAASTTVTWHSGDECGVLFGTAIHATLSGTGPVADFEFS
jgi:hypothetical protein